MEERKKVTKKLVPDNDVNKKKCIVRKVNAIKNCKENEHLCLFCQEFGQDNELWFCCAMCLQWAHAACTDSVHPEGYICDNCR